MGLFLHFHVSAATHHSGFVFAFFEMANLSFEVFRRAQDHFSAVPRSGFVFALSIPTMRRKSLGSATLSAPTRPDV
jgi:hypothetical protein